MKGHQEWEAASRSVRITCRACGDNRLVVKVTLPPPHLDRESAMHVDGGSRVEPSGHDESSIVAHCRAGHTISVRKDKLYGILLAMRGHERRVAELRL